MEDPFLRTIARGKLRPELLEEMVLPFIGIDDPQVIIKPRVGFDVGVVELDGQYLAMSTDPVIGVPSEFFGFFMVHYSASDVAMSGAKPRWLLPTIMLPEGFPIEKLREIMHQIDEELKKLGMGTVKGHTGVYPAIEEPTGASTVIGTVTREEIVTSAGARIGDMIIATKSMGLETAVALAFKHEILLKEKLGDELVDHVKKSVFSETCVDEALLAHEVGVTAMHDATEGGLFICLSEITRNSSVGCRIYESEIPRTAEIEKILDYFDIEPTTCSSTGTLIVTMDVQKSSEYLKKLEKRGIQASIIGEIVDKKERNTFHRRDGRVDLFPTTVDDPYSHLLY
jgi:hydrogenase maturation factor